MNCYFRLSAKEEKNFAVEKYMLRLLPVCIICIILFFLELAVFIVFAGNFNYVQLSFTVAKLTLLICGFLVGIIQIIHIGDECKCIRVAGQHFMFYHDNLN